MREKLAVLLPEFVIKEPEIIPRAKDSVWKEVIGYLFHILIWGTLAVVFGVVDVLKLQDMWIRVLVVFVCILVLAFILAGICLNFKTCGIGLEEKNLLIVQGSFSKASIWIPYSKMQEVQYGQGPMARHFGYASGVIYILAAVLDSVHPTDCFPVEVFEEIRKRMLQRKGKR